MMVFLMRLEFLVTVVLVGFNRVAGSSINPRNLHGLKTREVN